MAPSPTLAIQLGSAGLVVTAVAPPFAVGVVVVLIGVGVAVSVVLAAATIGTIAWRHLVSGAVVVDDPFA